MDNKEIYQIHESIDRAIEDSYRKGYFKVLNILNDRFLIKVWKEEDSKEFFNEVKETIRELNINAPSFKPEMASEYPFSEEDVLNLKPKIKSISNSTQNYD